MAKRLTRLVCLVLALLFAAAPLGGCSRERGLRVESGEKGKSAYQIAMKKGFDGTLAEWLDEIGNYWEDKEKAAELKELLTLKHELRVREDVFYRALYCGLCHRMGKCTGQCSRMTLNYDFVFLAAVRLACGCETPFDIFPAVWLASLCSVSVGLLAERGLRRWF